MPWCTNVAVALGKCAADIGCGTVLVIGQCIYDDSDSVRAISFICKYSRS